MVQSFFGCGRQGDSRAATATPSYHLRFILLGRAVLFLELFLLFFLRPISGICKGGFAAFLFLRHLPLSLLSLYGQLLWGGY